MTRTLLSVAAVLAAVASAAGGGCARLERAFSVPPEPARTAAPRVAIAPVAPPPVAAPQPVASSPAPTAPVTSAAPAGSALADVAAAPGDVEDETKLDDEPAPPIGPELVATLRETWIYAQPNFKAQKLGYLRAGAVVSRSEKPIARGSCESGWYRIAPRGYVCAGIGASLNLDHPVVEMARRRPDRKAGLPYTYGMSKYPTPPFYLKLPSAEEQRSVEGDVSKLIAKQKEKEKDGPRELDPVPAALLYGQVIPSLTPNHHGAGALYAGRAVPRSGFALLSQFEWEGRSFGVTTDLFIVPLDRMRILAPSGFHGIELKESGLPVVFVRQKGSHLVRRRADGGLEDAGALGYRDAVPLSGESSRIDGSSYLATRDGRLLRDDHHLVRIEPPKEWPSFALEGKKWIDISILRQTLVAYEGQKPVYATLVSTGADGLGDPKETHSTVRGAFLIHTKHIAVTMDSDEMEDRFDLRDVPYVQYFHEGYALHAAYWHDDFGRPKSHGCVNLHPTDAAWLFGWTDPGVPDGWHAALSPTAGTVVYIHA
jgi:hypothetical protein